MPNMNPEKCSELVYKEGVSVGLFDMPKKEAEALCERLTKETGRLHDWHYIGGRVHVKALTYVLEPEVEGVEGIWA